MVIDYIAQLKFHCRCQNIRITIGHSSSRVIVSIYPHYKYAWVCILKHTLSYDDLLSAFICLQSHLLSQILLYTLPDFLQGTFCSQKITFFSQHLYSNTITAILYCQIVNLFILPLHTKLVNGLIDFY